MNPWFVSTTINLMSNETGAVRKVCLCDKGKNILQWWSQLFFLDESQMAKLFNTVCARRFLKTMFFLQSWNTSKKQTSPLHAVFIPLWFFRLISYSVHNSTKLTKSWFVCNWCFYDGRSSFYDWEIFYEGPTVCCYIYNLKQ